MHKSLLFFTSFICIAIFSVNAFSQNRWKLSAVDTNGTKFYIDETLSQQPNGNLLGWQKSELPPNNIYPPGSYFIARYEWNCSDKIHRQLQFLIYNRLGNFIEQLDTDKSWKDIAPESVAEVILNDVCSVLRKAPNKTSAERAVDGELFAQIIVRNANLLSEANSLSRIIRKVSIGEKLILVSRESVGSFYQVIDPKTKTQGWLNGNNFKIVNAKKSARKSREKQK